MLNNSTTNLSQARYDAVAATEQHLHWHGASLCDLLDALDDPAGFEALLRLHAAISDRFPDADAIEDALWDIVRYLADQTPQHSTAPVANETSLRLIWHGGTEQGSANFLTGFALRDKPDGHDVCCSDVRQRLAEKSRWAKTCDLIRRCSTVKRSEAFRSRVSGPYQFHLSRLQRRLFKRWTIRPRKLMITSVSYRRVQAEILNRKRSLLRAVPNATSKMARF